MAPAGIGAEPQGVNMTEVIMPQMGESIAEGTISVWLVELGQYVKADQPLVTVSTDKADIDIPAPVSGVLAEVLVQAGTTVPVGKLIARIDETAAQVEGVPGAEAKREKKAEAEAVTVTEAPEKAETVVEGRIPEMAAKKDGPAEHPARKEGIPAAEAMKPPTPEEEITGPREIERAEPGAPGLAETGRAGFYSPAVLRLALEYDIDLKALKGTGEGGRITRADVMRAKEGVEAPRTEAPRPIAPPGPAPEGTSYGHPRASEAPEEPRIMKVKVGPPPEIEEAGPPAAGQPTAGLPAPPAGTYRPPVYEAEEGDTELPFSRLRRLIADHMVYSKRTSPHVTTVTEVDFEHIVGIKNRNKDKIKEEMGISLTFMPFVMLALVRALKDHPLMNSVVQGDVILTKKHINLGVAVDSERGLMVPVIRRAEDFALIELAKALNELSIKVKDRRVTPDELSGGTFTITNPGRHGNLFGTPIISQPQVGILRMGEVVKRAVVVEADGEDAIAIRPMMYLALSYDHRVVDGLTANEFLHGLKEHLETDDFGL